MKSILIKLSNVKDRILKAAEKKKIKLIMFKRIPIRVAAYFSVEILKARGK